MTGLSVQEFLEQLDQYKADLEQIGYRPGTQAIVIRGEHQDYGISAVHLDPDGTLVLDLGKAVQP